jgi:hypothetical protein
MVLQRTIAGFWVVKYRGAVWHTGTFNIVEAIRYALEHRKLTVKSEDEYGD